jgi:hypothetical protein
VENNALTLVNDAKKRGALIYVDMNDLTPSTELFRSEPQEILFEKKQFHNIKGKYQADKAATDKMAELGGIFFIDSASSERLVHKNDPIFGERDAWVVTAQGKKQNSDGSWRPSNIEAYEFDPPVRAFEDLGLTEINDSNRTAFIRKVIEYTKPALPRAKTGARLRVIRYLLGLPPSFTEDEIKRPMVFNRIVMNTAFVLSTPEGKMMATAKALGVDVSSLLFGERPNLSNAIEPSNAQSSAGIPPENLKPADTSGFDYGSDSSNADVESLANEAAKEKPESETSEDKAESEEFQKLTVQLEGLLESYGDKLDVWIQNHTLNPFNMAKSELDSFVATAQTRKDMIDRTMTFLKARGVAV